MKELSLFTVVFPASLPFLSPFLESLVAQSDDDFCVVVLNDGVQGLESYFEKYNLRYQIITSPSSKPHENRIFALNKIKESFKSILFIDSDDELGENRVAVVKSLLKNNDMVISDIDLISENGELLLKGYLSERLTNKQPIKAADLINKNIAGFTNTAVNIPNNHTFPELPENIKAVDWAVFHHLLSVNDNAIFTSECSTRYRQYNSNLVGMNEYSEKMVIKSVQEKIYHYSFMLELSLNDEIDYVGYLNYFNEIWRDKRELGNYSKQILANCDKNLFWWEIAKRI